MDVRAEPGRLDDRVARTAQRHRAPSASRSAIGTAAVAAVRHVLEPPRSRRSAPRAGMAASAGRCSQSRDRGFAGPVYPINPHAQTIAGRPAYAALADVPTPWSWPSSPSPHPPCPTPPARARPRRCPRSSSSPQASARPGRRPGAPGRAAGICRESGMRLVGPNCLGVLNTAPAVRDERDLRPRATARRTHRLRLPERRLRHRSARAVRAARPRALVVRVHGRQGRPVGQRLPALLGAGPGHRSSAAVSRVAGQPAALRPDRAAADGLQARHRGEERTDGRGTASGVVAHRRPAGGLRGHRRRPLRPRGRDPRRDARRAARRRRAARGQPLPAAVASRS